MYENGILHRDISFGNILICDVDDEDEMKDAGMLIDLDHAKYSAERIITPSHTYKWEDGENLLLRLFLEEQTSKLEPDSDVLSKTLKVFRVMTDASHYLREVFGTLPECLRNDNETSTALTANELYWPDKVYSVFTACIH
jgi:serine/threonine protein kinase